MDGGSPPDDRQGMSTPAGVDDLTTLSDRELTRLITQLERDEQSVSRRRTKLHERIDFLRSGGFASAEPGDDPLEELLVEERDISSRRLDLHYRIDRLRAERSRRNRER
jgi:hypothetical protein